MNRYMHKDWEIREPTDYADPPTVYVKSAHLKVWQMVLLTAMGFVFGIISALMFIAASGLVK